MTPGPATSSPEAAHHDRAHSGRRSSAPPARWARSSSGSSRTIPGSRSPRSRRRSRAPADATARSSAGARPRHCRQRIADMVVQRCAPPLDARVVFSALDAEVAGDIEQAFARAGAFVVTNTRVHRMDPDVPLLVPEVNAGHLELHRRAADASAAGAGAILANPNCSTAALVVALAPLHRRSAWRRCSSPRCRRPRAPAIPGWPRSTSSATWFRSSAARRRRWSARRARSSARSGQRRRHAGRDARWRRTATAFP